MTVVVHGPQHPLTSLSIFNITCTIVKLTKISHVSTWGQMSAALTFPLGQRTKLTWPHIVCLYSSFVLLIIHRRDDLGTFSPWHTLWIPTTTTTISIWVLFWLFLQQAEPNEMESKRKVTLETPCFQFQLVLLLLMMIMNPRRIQNLTGVWHNDTPFLRFWIRFQKMPCVALSWNNQQRRPM